jgi:cation diffusion facilitator CzcD-associated flavoprotein CzcO
VQAYLASYVEHFALGDAIRLGCEVVSAEPTEDGWELGAVDVATGATETTRASYLVVANGIFCCPFIPEFPGRDGFETAGERVRHASEFQDLEDARGKHVVVVGYGKSACDVAAAIADVTASMTVVARWSSSESISAGLTSSGPRSSVAR